MECVTEPIPYTATGRRVRRAMAFSGGVGSEKDPDSHLLHTLTSCV